MIHRSTPKKFNLLYAVCFALMPGLGHFFAGKLISAFAWCLLFYASYASAWWIFDSLSAPFSVIVGLGFILLIWVLQISHLILMHKNQKIDSPSIISRAINLIVGSLFIALSFPYLKDEWIKSHWQIFQIPSESMYPTLRKGDEVIAKMQFEPEEIKINNIVVFKSEINNQDFYIKRILGKPFDHLLIHHKMLYRNDTLVTDGFVQYTDEKTYSAAQSTRDFFEIQLKENEYFVLGDNRDNSTDSRSFGPIFFEQIYGIAQSIYTTIDPLSGQIRWERLGVKLNKLNGSHP